MPTNGYQYQRSEKLSIVDRQYDFVNNAITNGLKMAQETAGKMRSEANKG